MWHKIAQINFSYTVLAILVLNAMVDFSLGIIAQKQMLFPNVRVWTKDYLCEVSDFYNFSNNDIITWVSIFHGNASPT